ncbi:MAG: ABC transporter substrate-binding protein [Ferrimonas sp.]
MKLVFFILALTWLGMPLYAAERVVSAGAGITELVLLLGGQPQLVAVDSTSVVPDDAKGIAVLGYHRALSAEGLLAQQPDLLLGSEEMGPATALKLIEDAGVPIQILPAANSPQQLLDNLSTIAVLLGRDHRSASVQLQTQLQRIANLRAELQRPPVVIFALLRGDRAPKLGGHNTAADRIISLAGGVNGAEFDGYKIISEETLLTIKPDLILVSKPNMDGDHPEPLAQEVVAALMTSLPLLAFTPAGLNQQVINLPPQALLGGLGPSALNAAESLAQQLVVLP